MRIRLYMALTLTVGKTVALSRLVADTPGCECSLDDGRHPFDGSDDHDSNRVAPSNLAQLADGIHLRGGFRFRDVAGPTGTSPRADSSAR